MRDQFSLAVGLPKHNIRRIHGERCDLYLVGRLASLDRGLPEQRGRSSSRPAGSTQRTLSMYTSSHSVSVGCSGR
eukprot:1324543-Amphidinium_carterae.1